jgi:hypothetical protein
MKKLTFLVVIGASIFTSCKKGGIPPSTDQSTVCQIRVESVSANDSITYSPIVVVR